MMHNDFLYDYYKVDFFCKSEGLNTEYFIINAGNDKQRRWKEKTHRLVKVFKG